jgi:cytochrome d ubiquinol oxidase subunit I
MLSILAYHDPSHVVQGLDKVPAADQPPINVVRIAFQTMVFIGTFLAAVGALFVFVWWRKRRLPQSKWFLRAVVACGPLSVVALIAGWVTTEVGRQPWIVYQFMRTEQAVTGAGGIPVGYGTLVVVYICVAAMALVMLRRLGRKPLELELPDAA